MHRDAVAPAGPPAATATLHNANYINVLTYMHQSTLHRLNCAEKHRLPWLLSYATNVEHGVNRHGLGVLHGGSPGSNHAWSIKSVQKVCITPTLDHVLPHAPSGRHCGTTMQTVGESQPTQRTDPCVSGSNGQIQTLVTYTRAARPMNAPCAQWTCPVGPQACDICPLCLAAQPGADPYWLPTYI